MKIEQIYTSYNSDTNREDKKFYLLNRLSDFVALDTPCKKISNHIWL